MNKPTDPDDIDLSPEFPKRVRHLATAAVTVTHKHAGKVVSEDTKVSRPEVGGVQHVAHPVYITIKGGITRNTGDYNSVQVQVSYSVPVFPGQPSADVVALLAGLDEAYAQISSKVDEKVMSELEMALGVNPHDSGVPGMLPGTTSL